MRRKGLLIVLIILFLLTLGASIFILKYGPEIRSFLYSLRYSQSEIESQLEENRQKVQAVTEQHPEITVREPTEDEKQAIREQTISTEELIQRLTSSEPKEQEPVSVEPNPTEQVPEEKPPAPTGEPEPAATEPPEPPEPTGPTKQEQYEKKLSELIAETYILRETFTQKLDDIEQRARAEYKTLPKEKKKTSEMIKFAERYVNEALSLESECSDRMDVIISQMDILIRENNGDPSVIDAVVDAYIEEKSLKKAWYFTELQKRGWIQK